MNKDVVNELLDLIINQTKSGVLGWTEQERKYTSNDGRLTMTKTVVLKEDSLEKILNLNRFILALAYLSIALFPKKKNLLMTIICQRNLQDYLF